MEVQATGAKLKLEPWDGDVFTAKLMPLGKFALVVENSGPCGPFDANFRLRRVCEILEFRMGCPHAACRTLELCN